MERTIDSTKKIREVYTALTPTELDTLKNKTRGYGFFLDAARKIGIHKNSLRNIMCRGYGTPSLVEKIKSNYLYESHPYQSPEDQERQGA